MKKYLIKQNNPGGKWVINNDVAEYLIIEAENCEKATEKLLSILKNNDDNGYGDYCPCCGDRWWTEVSEEDATTEDEIQKIISRPAEWWCNFTVIEYLSSGKVRRFLYKATGR